MKSLRWLLLLVAFVFVSPQAEAQIWKRIKKKAEQKIEEKAEEKVDEILKDKDQNEEQETPPEEGETPSEESPNGQENPQTEEVPGMETEEPPITINSKFDFVPGDKLLFYDDYADDFLGDFPSKWNTNGSGELVEVSNSEHKWLKIMPGYNTYYIPNIYDLPKEFTAEFDVLATGLDRKTSSQSYLRIIFTDNDSFQDAKNYAMAEYSFCQFIGQGVTIENRINGKRVLRNDMQGDFREVINKKHHVSIAVNEQRFRLWINQQKYVDIPRMMPPDAPMKAMKIKLRGIDINKEVVMIANLKIAEGGLDLRKQLMAEGKVSTNGILFDSGSATIQPQSYGIIRQISQVLKQDKAMQLNIIGHTDADGSDEANLSLSKKRADAVKNALAVTYGIDGSRLTTEGKGEGEPVADNSTEEGKAQNRRVEFVRI